jgi:hypothetical protein
VQKERETAGRFPQWRMNRRRPGADVSDVLVSAVLMPEGNGVRRLYLQKNLREILIRQKIAQFKGNESLDKRFDYSTDSIHDDYVKESPILCEIDIIK